MDDLYGIERAHRFYQVRRRVNLYRKALRVGHAEVLDEPCPIHPNRHYAVGLFKDSTAVVVGEDNFGLVCPIFLFLIKAHCILAGSNAGANMSDWLEKKPLKSILKSLEEKC